MDYLFNLEQNRSYNQYALQLLRILINKISLHRQKQITETLNTLKYKKIKG